MYGIVPRGALLISCYIVGTSDRPPVHDINEINEGGEDGDNFINIPND